MQHATHASKQHAAKSAPTPSPQRAHGNGAYGRLMLMIALSFLAMYGLMYAMVDTFDNAVPNLNQVYMAGLMTAPMVMLELALMGGMYPNKRINAVIWGVTIVALAAFWILIRQQSGIGDRQFLRSMIPHHAGALLMCEEASIQDPQIQQLCKGILASQQAEITLMTAKLEELSKN